MPGSVALPHPSETEIPAPYAGEMSPGDREFNHICTTEEHNNTLVGDAVLILDEYLTITYCNEQYLEYERCTYEDIIGKNLMRDFLKMVPPGLYASIGSISPGMVRKHALMIPGSEAGIGYHYQILGTLHGNGRPGTIILIQGLSDISHFNN